MSEYVLSLAMSGEQASDYAKALTDADTLDKLRALVTAYKPLALDAKPVVDAMSATDFEAFRKGLKSERRGKFAGDAWAARFGAVLMPMPMMRVSRIADQYKVPFGVVWKRCQDLCPDLLTVEGATAMATGPAQGQRRP